MRMGVMIDYDHHSYSRQKKVTATFLHSCLREGRTQAHPQLEASLFGFLLYQKDWLSPWERL